jgi:hypothetical protein
MVFMNSAINLHLAAARAADLERASRRRGSRDLDPSRRERRAHIGGRRRRLHG